MSLLGNQPPSGALSAGTYALYGGVEVRLDRRGQGWILRANERTPGFTRNEHGQYVKLIAVGDPLELECFRLKYHGTYRGLAFEVQSLGEPVMAWTRDSRSLAEGFKQVDRGEYRKTISLSDPDLEITTVRTRIPAPWIDHQTPAWSDYRDRLVEAFRGTNDRVIVIISSTADPKRYVQFAGQSGVLDAEAPGTNVVAEAKQQVMADAGWSAPGPAQPNWTSSLELPALTSEYKALADRCVAALRHSYGIAHPSELVYNAWREPEQMPAGVTWSADQVKQLDRGAKAVEFPSLSR
ncbi:hypothetical protein OHC50_12600 [Paenarthrobacter ilicis]|uniref:TY-Chap domain-containing protein n=1 Tax=Paenarthrobacter ilicis TaxID=43665 RepID=UPI0030098CAA